VGILGALLGGLAVFSMLHDQCATKAAKATTTAVTQARTIEHHQGAVAQAVGQQVAAANTQTQKATNEAVRYVPRLVPMPSDLRYQLSNGWVRVVDASISGDVSGLAKPAAEPDDDPSQVDPASAATTLIQDFGICHQAITGYEGWNKWANDNGMVPPKGGDQ
jgi:hypothetical protein